MRLLCLLAFIMLIFLFTVPVKPLYSVKTVQEDAQSLEVATTFPDLPAINEGGQPSFLGLIYRKVTSPDLACPEGKCFT
ncbi:hypothetical protein DPMN_083158 [Dreissena polymorpha]|uniref:Uncharacterized protein n=1 Tax=Dreissena polymorpha TaxID=45954 RepID=A0A9D3YC44_DREPO|nr:hypothetical protein DPMN_083158 [Dreissena polymorpha]